MANIIEKLKKAKLVGRSGSAFPTAQKWEMVKKAKAKKKYIICNASEGEKNVFKDGYLLDNHLEEIIEGIKIALKTIDCSEAYICLRKDYYDKHGKRLKKLIGRLPIALFKKLGGYIAGEETCICEAMEGKPPQPRRKPPYVTEKGLFGCPTLVNNVETFYRINQIDKGKYEEKRLYAISGDVKKKGVYDLPEKWTIEKILKETGNYPDFDFFVQMGGGACGQILLPKELKQPVCGIGAIVVYSRKRNLFEIMKDWAEYFHYGNCNKCVPCREGVYRIMEQTRKKKLDKKILQDLFFVLEETSFCSLGKIAPTPFKGTIKKLLK